MFYRIKNNKLYDYANNKYADDCLETNIITQSELDADKNKVIVQDGILVINPDYASQRLAKSRQAKYDENDSKAEEARTSKEFTLTLQGKECEFDTKSQTQTDLLTAFAVCSQGETYDGWVCNNGVVINLTLSDVTTISVKFKELSNVYPHWNYYKNLIDNATTYQEVEVIVIDYDIEV